MPRILLLLQQRGNRQLLSNWLSRNYEVSIGASEQDLDQPFDLAILDTPMLHRLHAGLQLRKSSELPVYLPFLLITSRQGTGALASDVWDVLDELILAPIDPVELKARVEVLFRVRQDSLALKRHNDELEAFIAEMTGAFEVAEDETQLIDILLTHALRISRCDSGGVVILADGCPQMASLRGDALQHLNNPSSLQDVIAQARQRQHGMPPHVSEKATERNQVVAPILINNRVAGAIVLNKDINDQDNSEQRLLKSLCAQAGVFLHNLQQAHRLVEAARLYQQLELAEAVQKQLLPLSKSGLPGFETAAFYQATNRVGGDYYDIIETGPQQIAAVIADVAGHSLSAGLVMTAARSAFRVLLQREDSPAAVIEQLNQVLFPDLDETNVFISLCLIVVDLDTMSACYANAGHCAPMIFRQDPEAPFCMDATGVPMGILAEPGYTEEHVSLSDGDTIILYTDGITEARNAAGEFWSESGLIDCVKNADKRDAESISRAVVESARRYSNDQLDDDLTVLVLKIKDVRQEKL